MKSLFFILGLLAVLSAYAQSQLNTEDLYRRRGEIEPLPISFEGKDLSAYMESDLLLDVKDLKQVKYFLINGETKLARIALAKIAYKESKLKPVIYRYLGMIAFIEGEFSRSYDYLSDPILQSIPHFAKICTLKILNGIILNKIRTIETDWGRCQVENPFKFVLSVKPWMETLIQLKLYPERGMTQVPFQKVKLTALELSDIKVVLKLALYLNQEHLLEKQIAELTTEQLVDPEIRELAGQVLFRLGSLAKSYRFVEDLKSPNAENIKGNLYVLRTKYELAYGQFKLALEQKQNSQNALERLLPLAWLLGDWQAGAEYAERVIASPQTQINKLTLLAAFLTQKGDFADAAKILDVIGARSRRGAEIDVTQLYSFVSLMLNRPEQARKQADESCSQYDLVNCWMLFQLSQWEAFPITIKRDDEVYSRREWDKLTKEEINKPIKETVFVNQLDIEELDDKLIQLTPLED